LGQEHHHGRGAIGQLAATPEAHRQEELVNARGVTHHRRPFGCGIRQSRFHKGLPYALAASLWGHVEVGELPTLAVGAQHHHPQHLAFAHDEPEALTAMAISHHSSKHIVLFPGEQESSKGFNCCHWAASRFCSLS
jgi:hypothetical protein